MLASNKRQNMKTNRTLKFEGTSHDPKKVIERPKSKVCIKNWRSQKERKNTNKNRHKSLKCVFVYTHLGNIQPARLYHP